MIGRIQSETLPAKQQLTAMTTRNETKITFMVEGGTRTEDFDNESLNLFKKFHRCSKNFFVVFDFYDDEGRFECKLQSRTSLSLEENWFSVEIVFVLFAVRVIVHDVSIFINLQGTEVILWHHQLSYVNFRVSGSVVSLRHVENVGSRLEEVGAVVAVQRETLAWLN
jgi:hypothetical protein